MNAASIVVVPGDKGNVTWSSEPRSNVFVPVRWPILNVAPEIGIAMPAGNFPSVKIDAGHSAENGKAALRGLCRSYSLLL